MPPGPIAVSINLVSQFTSGWCATAGRLSQAISFPKAAATLWLLWHGQDAYECYRIMAGYANELWWQTAGALVADTVTPSAVVSGYRFYVNPGGFIPYIEFRGEGPEGAYSTIDAVGNLGHFGFCRFSKGGNFMAMQRIHGNNCILRPQEPFADLVEIWGAPLWKAVDLVPRRAVWANAMTCNDGKALGPNTGDMAGAFGTNGATSAFINNYPGFPDPYSIPYQQNPDYMNTEDVGFGYFNDASDNYDTREFHKLGIAQLAEVYQRVCTPAAGEDLETYSIPSGGYVVEPAHYIMSGILDLTVTPSAVTNWIKGGPGFYGMYAFMTGPSMHPPEYINSTSQRLIAPVQPCDQLYIYLRPNVTGTLRSREREHPVLPTEWRGRELCLMDGTLAGLGP